MITLHHDIQNPTLVYDSFQIVESCVEGMRKPSPAIFKLMLERLEVDPHEAVFLDDIGSNLKAAREMGIHTIKVNEHYVPCDGEA